MSKYKPSTSQLTVVAGTLAFFGSLGIVYKVLVKKY